MAEDRHQWHLPDQCVAEKKFTSGDLEEKVEVTNTDEFKALSEGINATVAALKNAIKETAARIDAELQFARAIPDVRIPDPIGFFRSRYRSHWPLR